MGTQERAMYGVTSKRDEGSIMEMTLSTRVTGEAIAAASSAPGNFVRFQLSEVMLAFPLLLPATGFSSSAEVLNG